MKRKTKYFFKQMQGHVPIPSFGSTFTVSVWSRHCVLGPKYYKSRESGVPEHLEDHMTPRKRLKIMDTRKSNCPPTLNMKCIRVYPDFIMQSIPENRDTKAKVENARSIHEALDIFKDWNKDWNPLYWVTDFLESEIKAMKQAFPKTKVYLCLFHQKQTWGRWLEKKDNLHVPNDMKAFLDIWQEISESPTQREFRIRV
ncbi:uncharacterized protein LOC126191579 isoform X2 [Schistocerca cancellata]|uniref:uncharacterized protein LOC126191579 isoform X2 n=1 Tax=Schistocerca cancellata TaxID=274614 RepID=UPI0021176555|nr:uncharacterized protein LOC126191579 isoform X2 [Schistocerca cancellata]